MFHLANSAGALRFPEARFSAVRLGSVLYAQLGMASKLGLNLADPFTAKAKVTAVRDLKKGDSVGYSREFVALQDMRLAVIPYGYGDGFGVQASARELTIKDSVQNMSRDIGRLMLKRYKRGVYYQGRLLNALGRVAMQSMMVDISNEPEIKVGDVVEAPMRRTSASARLPRVYVRDGKVVAIRVLIAENLSF
jgi:alanine racemase